LADWVALAGIGSTALVAISAQVTSALTSRGDRKHERLLAKEAREQQRLENAYVDLLDMAEQAGQWGQMVYPLMDTNPPKPVPIELPSLEEQVRTVALVRAFGSDEVLERMETWLDVVMKMITTVELIKWEEAEPATRQSDDEPIARVTLGELRTEERTTREALANQVAVELGHRTDAKPDTSPQE
jgi:hypothetical protein